MYCINTASDIPTFIQIVNECYKKTIGFGLNSKFCIKPQSDDPVF